MSIKNALGITNPVKKRHITAIDMQNLIGDVAWKDAFKFSFFRDQ